jgi:site-specific DNA-methyltransferase (adenine-specific)
MIQLLHGDCLELMKSIPDKSIDAIITDPPYGTTACKWDSVIPFDLMWQQLNRIIKDNCAIVLFGSQPFTSALVMSNTKMFKYEWIWEKNAGSNFASVRFQPMKEHENVLVFSKGKTTYNQQKQDRIESGFSKQKTPLTFNRKKNNDVYGGLFVGNITKKYIEKLRCPRSIQKFNRERGLHPTQKPVALIEYLIKTYTNENETVLDFTMGSGTTGVACKNLNRKFIGIEMDNNYFSIAENRISNHVVIKELF